MGLTTEIARSEGKVTIRLSGRLDSTNADAFLAQVKAILLETVESVEFQVSELDYVTSAGLRVFLHLRQKLGGTVSLVMKGANEIVHDVFRMSGIEKFVAIQD